MCLVVFRLAHFAALCEGAISQIYLMAVKKMRQVGFVLVSFRAAILRARCTTIAGHRADAPF